MAEEEQVGVIIANTGSPDDATPQAVARYLRQFLGNPRIVPMNRVAWSIILNLFIVPVRSRRSAAKYATVHTPAGFQFILDHEQLARKLQRSFREAGRDVRVASAMSFGNPSIEHAVKGLLAQGCGRIVVLPLYPQNAYSQASIVADEVARLGSRGGIADRLQVVGDYSANDSYLQAIADSVSESGFDASRDKLLMSFHSIPRADIEAGDTYERTVLATCDAVAGKLGLPGSCWRVGFQSRFDKDREWLSPFSLDVLRGWVDEGFAGRLFVVCPNFSVDCLETYYDIEREMRASWLQMRSEAGLPADDAAFAYVSCLGASDRHVEVLRSVLDAAVLA